MQAAMEAPPAACAVCNKNPTPPRFVDLLVMLADAYERDIAAVKAGLGGAPCEQRQALQASLPGAPEQEPPTMLGSQRNSGESTAPWPRPPNEPEPEASVQKDKLRQLQCDGEDLDGDMFKMRSGWSAAIHKKRRRQSNLARVKSLEMEEAGRKPTSVRVSNSLLGMCVLHPGSHKRLSWDLASISFLIYDMMVIPVGMAFPLPESSFLTFMTWATVLFWTCDVFMSTITGFVRGKVTVLVPSEIFRNYARTWLPFDIFIISMDWCLMMWRGGSAAGLGRALRALRIVRALRMVRILKLKQMLQSIQDTINTEAVALVFGILKNVCSLVVASHLIACGWYVLSDNAGPVSWVSEHGIRDMSVGYAYFTSLHWSLTQFTPASMEVFPQNIRERCYAVAVLLFALVAFSSFVSALTASITQLRGLSSKESREFWMLRRYLRDWGVRKSLNVRVQRYLEYASKQQQKRIQAKQVQLLSMLPKPLYDELKCDSFSEQLSPHPLFARCRSEVQTLGRALDSFCVSSGEVIFKCGLEGAKVYFPFGAKGSFSYNLGIGDAAEDVNSPSPQESGPTWLSLPSVVSNGPNDTSPSGDGASQHGAHSHLGTGDWIGEPVLWAQWYYVGDFQAIVESEVISVDACAFEEAIRDTKHLFPAFQRYAIEFVRELNFLEVDELTDMCQKLFHPSELLSKAEFSPARVTDDKATVQVKSWWGIRVIRAARLAFTSSSKQKEKLESLE